MDANKLIRDYENAQSKRANFETIWQEVAERVLPREAYFGTKGLRDQAEKKTERIFDSTAILANERFAAAMESMLTPRTQKWHELRHPIDAINDNPEVKKWLQSIRDLLFKVRYSPKGNFASQMYEVYLCIGAFGTGAIFIDDLEGEAIRYKAIHLSKLYIEEDFSGVINTVYRSITLTGAQAVSQFGVGNLPVTITDEKNKDRDFEFVHIVKPNTKKDKSRKDYMGMDYYSCYISVEDKQIIKEGGYYTFPYAIGRYVTAPDEKYGRSPAMTALAEIKTANQINKTMLSAAEQAVNPPLLLTEDGVLGSFDLRAGALNYGGIDANGTAMVQALDKKSNFPIGSEMLERTHKAINDTFLVTLFQILVDSPSMTATEAMLRSQEKGALLAPTMGRQQSELLGRIIEREIDILSRAGLIPQPPQIVLENGASIDIEYVSPLNKAQKSEDGVAIMNTIQSIIPLMQVDPSIMDNFDLDKTATKLADIQGMPSDTLRSDEEKAKMRESRVQAQQAQQLLSAAPVITQSAKNLSEIQGKQEQPNIPIGF